MKEAKEIDLDEAQKTIKPCPLCGQPGCVVSGHSLGLGGQCTDNSCILGRIWMRLDEWNKRAVPSDMIKVSDAKILGEALEMVNAIPGAIQSMSGEDILAVGKAVTLSRELKLTAKPIKTHHTIYEANNGED